MFSKMLNHEFKVRPPDEGWIRSLLGSSGLFQCLTQSVHHILAGKHRV